MPFWPGSLPEGASPQDAAAVQRITDEGWAYLTLQPAQIKGSVQNYTLPFIGGLRFPNADGIGSGQNFTKKGAGFNNEWHYNHEGSKKLMVSASGEQVPQNLRYKTFFYNACSSGPHYVENFQHGEFIYTNRTCQVFKATQLFVKGVVEGKSTNQIIAILHAQNASGLGSEETVYQSHNF